MHQPGRPRGASRQPEWLGLGEGDSDKQEAVGRLHDIYRRTAGLGERGTDGSSSHRSSPRHTTHMAGFRSTQPSPPSPPPPVSVTTNITIIPSPSWASPITLIPSPPPPNHCYIPYFSPSSTSPHSHYHHHHHLNPPPRRPSSPCSSIRAQTSGYRVGPWTPFLPPTHSIHRELQGGGVPFQVANPTLCIGLGSPLPTPQEPRADSESLLPAHKTLRVLGAPSRALGIGRVSFET